MNIYDECKNNSLWGVIDKALSDLVENQDIKEFTCRDYIVGYFVKKIDEYEKSFNK